MNRSPLPRSTVLLALPISLAVSGLLGCDPGPTEPEVEPDPAPVVSSRVGPVGDTVILELGESVSFRSAGIEVTFLHLVADFRCPVEVTCVWEGDAEVRVEILAEDARSRVALHTSLDPRSAAVGSYELELLSVLPLPAADPVADPATPRIVVSLGPSPGPGSDPHPRSGR